MAHPQSSRITKLTSLAEQVYEHLRVAIIRAEIPPGEKLVELDIAAHMGTSQGPVREALQRLERDGLVERRARSATFVTHISIEQIYELFSVRSVIEGFAIRRITQTITADQCELLDELIRKMEQAGSQKDIVTLAEYDMQFHRHIVEWAGSPGLLYAWIPLCSQIQRFIVQTHPEWYPDFVEVGIRHQPIVAALRSQNGDNAVKTINGHIMDIWTKIQPY